MLKYFFLSVIIITLTGAGCKNSLLPSQTNNPTPTKTNSNPEIIRNLTNQNTPLTAKDKNFPEINIKIFSDPNADFTFAYPDQWTYREYIPHTFLKNKSRTWIFSFQNQPILTVSKNPEEAAFDSCIAQEPSTPESLSQFTIFQSNDPNTTIIEEVCGLPRYIYWIPEKKLLTSSDFFKLNSEEKKNLHIMYINIDAGLPQIINPIFSNIAQSIHLQK